MCEESFVVWCHPVYLQFLNPIALDLIPIGIKQSPDPRRAWHGVAIATAPSWGLPSSDIWVLTVSSKY